MNTTVKNELLAIARQQVFNEYIELRTKDLDRWMLESDIAWKRERIKLPYPSFPVYPTEEDIINRVQILSKSTEENTEEIVEEKQKPNVKVEVLNDDKPVEILPGFFKSKKEQ